MKTIPAAQRPKAKVLYYLHTDYANAPCLAVPCLTRKEAKERERWENLGWEEKRDELSGIIQDEMGRSDSPFNSAIAVLARMGMRP